MTPNDARRSDEQCLTSVCNVPVFVVLCGTEGRYFVADMYGTAPLMLTSFG
jgi:hypothetical protein